MLMFFSSLVVLIGKWGKACLPSPTPLLKNTWEGKKGKGKRIEIGEVKRKKMTNPPLLWTCPTRTVTSGYAFVLLLLLDAFTPINQHFGL